MFNLKVGQFKVLKAAPYYDKKEESLEYGIKNAPNFTVERGSIVTVIDEQGRKTKMKVLNADNGSRQISLGKI